MYSINKYNHIIITRTPLISYFSMTYANPTSSLLHLLHRMLNRYTPRALFSRASSALYSIILYVLSCCCPDFTAGLQARSPVRLSQYPVLFPWSDRGLVLSHLGFPVPCLPCLSGLLTRLHFARVNPAFSLPRFTGSYGRGTSQSRTRVAGSS